MKAYDLQHPFSLHTVISRTCAVCLIAVSVFTTGRIFTNRLFFIAATGSGRCRCCVCGPFVFAATGQFVCKRRRLLVISFCVINGPSAIACWIFALLVVYCNYRKHWASFVSSLQLAVTAPACPGGSFLFFSYTYHISPHTFMLSFFYSGNRVFLGIYRAQRCKYKTGMI